MATTLKIVFLVVLAFGFLFEVEGIKCNACIQLSGISTCRQRDCPSTSGSCLTIKGKGKLGGNDVAFRRCSMNPATGGTQSCRPVDDNVVNGTECECFTDLCNTADLGGGGGGGGGGTGGGGLKNHVGHLHGWTFAQLIAISFVVVVSHVASAAVKS